ncbi:MAG: TIGR03013 family XrtA/PEP-CTERM system glycosyltransferase [Dokdonella sp.]
MLRILRKQSMRWLLLLALCEAVMLALSLMFATHLRYWNKPDHMAMHSSYLFLRALVFGVTVVGALAALGLYQPRIRERWRGLLVRQLIGFALGWVGAALLYYMMPSLDVGRAALGMALLIAFPLVGVFRVIFLRLIDVDALKRRVLVLGCGRRAATIVEKMRRRVDRRGFTIVGFVPLEGETPEVAENLLVAAPDGVRACAERLEINEIVVGPDDRRGILPMDELLDCRQVGIAITMLSSFFEREAGRVQLSLTDPSWLLFSGGFDASPLRRVTKRTFDVVAAAMVLLLTWPLMLLTAAAVMIESGPAAPVLYRQERVGEQEKLFRLTKFRSMRTDAEKDGVARWATKDDDRVTRVGRFIRKTRLDELPQLWNVLRGDMSFIGPRPERPAFVADLSKKIRFYRIRHSVKPGLTGWAQLNYPYGASEQDAFEKLKYDLFYVKNHNLVLDMMILVQTVEVVLFGRGAR